MTHDPQAATADFWRAEYRYYMRRAAKGIFDQDDAYELVHACMELGRMGYRLNEDETDWLPPTEVNRE